MLPSEGTGQARECSHPSPAWAVRGGGAVTTLQSLPCQWPRSVPAFSSLQSTHFESLSDVGQSVCLRVLASLSALKRESDTPGLPNEGRREEEGPAVLPPGCATQATCPTSLSLFSCLRSEVLLAVTRPPVPSTGRAPARAGLLMAVTRVDTPTTWQGGISREAKRLRWYSFLSHAAARMQPGTSKLCSLKPVRTRQHGEGPYSLML